MKFLSTSLALIILTLSSPVFAQNNCPTTLNFTKRYLASEKSVRLCDEFHDQVLLIVNTASYCGFTSQYRSLETLYQKYRARGFVVLGFPSNDFLQEPKDEKKVQEFCQLTYNVKFPMFEKTRVAKRRAEPFFRALAEAAGQYPRWNFHKYLLSRDGKVSASYSSLVKPDSRELIAAIESLL